MEYLSFLSVFVVVSLCLGVVVGGNSRSCVGGNSRSSVVVSWCHWW
jgi:hypothetical protein